MSSVFVVIRSVLSAFIGVQNETQREQDFSQSSPWPYILTGLVLTLIFVVLLVLLVRWLSQ